jgi:hypothetical protein
MQLVMLLQSDMWPVPEQIEIEASWGDVCVVNGEGQLVAQGEHVLLSGPAGAFKDWLRPFDGVWVGVGIPMEQRFEAMHIKD